MCSTVYEVTLWIDSARYLYGLVGFHPRNVPDIARGHSSNANPAVASEVHVMLLHESIHLFCRQSAVTEHSLELMLSVKQRKIPI